MCVFCFSHQNHLPTSLSFHRHALKQRIANNIVTKRNLFAYSGVFVCFSESNSVRLIYSALYKFQAHVNYFSAFQAHNLKCEWVIKRLLCSTTDHLKMSYCRHFLCALFCCCCFSVRCVIFTAVLPCRSLPCLALPCNAMLCLLFYHVNTRWDVRSECAHNFIRSDVTAQINSTVSDEHLSSQIYDARSALNDFLHHPLTHENYYYKFLWFPCSIYRTLDFSARCCLLFVRQQPIFVHSHFGSNKLSREKKTESE